MWKWNVLWLAIFVGGVSAILYVSSHNTGTVASAETAVVAPDFDQERAWKDLLYQVESGYRIPGTENHKKVRDWLVTELTASAAAVTTQEFSHKLGGADRTMWNVIATFPGAGDEPRERVLLAAHWDSRPTADQDAEKANRLKPINGANDGASGVAVLLEIGRQLKAKPIARDVTIVLFDGEDFGPTIDDMLLGSKYYAENLPKEKPDWGILLDMIGDKNLDIYREPNSDTYALEVNDRVFHAARELGYVSDTGGAGFIDAPFKYEILDDHIALNKAGVPMVDLIDFNYPAWHTLQDTVDQCSADSLAMVGKTVLYTLQQ